MNNKILAFLSAALSVENVIYDDKSIIYDKGVNESNIFKRKKGKLRRVNDIAKLSIKRNRRG